MSKISTADCKKLLDGFTSPFLKRVATVTKLTPSDTWIRIRKYKDAQGAVCRDFANTGVPAVVILVERPGGLEVKRERGLGLWEKAYATHIEDDIEEQDTVDDYQDKILWYSLQAEDFAFGVGTDDSGVLDAGQTHYYFIQPVTVGANDPWDQHVGIDHFLPAAFRGCQECEATFVFGGGDVTAQLLALGLTHDAALDNVSGS